MSEISIDTTPDGVEDQLGEDLRLTLLLAAQAAQRTVQMFDERSRDTARETQDNARRFQAELQAHHAAALAATEGAGTDRWWQDASPREMAAAWQAARVWEGRDPELTDRVSALREGFADRYGVTDPDQLRLIDLMAMRGDNVHRQALLASPLAEADWQATQARVYGEELRAEGARLRAELADLPPGQREFVAGDQVQGFDRREWLESRLHAVEQTAAQAQTVQHEAESRVDRLRSTGAKAPSQQDWAASWDTPQRREALRSRLERANVPTDAATARILTDRAQGLPPQAATWRPPTGSTVARPQPLRRVQSQRRSRS